MNQSSESTATASKTNDNKVLLPDFFKLNPHSKISEDTKFYYIEHPWGTDDARLKINKSSAKILSNLYLNPRFDGFYDVKNKIYEFVWGFINPAQPNYTNIVEREFEISFEGKTYLCYFDKPSDVLYELSECFERLPSEEPNRTLPQMYSFKESKNKAQNERLKNFFKNKIPVCFFIKATDESLLENVMPLARHINFLMQYYDRMTPIITIKAEISDNRSSNTILRYLEPEFPKALTVKQMDDIMLKLLDVGREHSYQQPRFAYIYYYQVLEYAGHNYIDEKSKRAIRNLLRDPAVINCSEEKFSQFFSHMTDLNHTDDVKIKKTIEEHCDPAIIWKEIEHNLEFFSEGCAFDGGFTLPPFVAKTITEETWCTMWTPKLYDQLTKIRNALVHAKERRETKVIHPSINNNYLLSLYLPLVRRAAEQVALKIP